MTSDVRQATVDYQTSARVPVILTSRADSVIARLASCAVAALVAQACRQDPSKAVA